MCFIICHRNTTKVSSVYLVLALEYMKTHAVIDQLPWQPENPRKLILGLMIPDFLRPCGADVSLAVTVLLNLLKTFFFLHQESCWQS